MMVAVVATVEVEEEATTEVAAAIVAHISRREGAPAGHNSISSRL